MRLLAAALLVGPTAAPACNVPVFRYALERWTPDPFVFVIFHRDPFTPEQQAVVEEVQKASQERLANLVVRTVDVAGGMPAPFRALWNAQANPTLPWLVVRYPAQTGIEPPVWAGPLDHGIAAALVDSPARRELAQRLIRGDAAVWLLLESGDPKQDEAVQRMLETESSKLQRTLELPKPAPDDPPMSLDRPLTITFSTLRIARSNPAERLLVNQLLNWHPGLKDMARPMVFPVFGRGRVLPPAVGEEIRGEVIGAMARLVTGPCSCQIKEMNPGCDLLMTANWNALFEGRDLKSPELPPLISMAQFALDASNHSSASFAPPILALSAMGPATDTASSHPLGRHLAALLGTGALFLAVTTLVLKLRTDRSPR